MEKGEWRMENGECVTVLKVGFIVQRVILNSCLPGGRSPT
jgi:hypothetical protein